MTLLIMGSGPVFHLGHIRPSISPCFAVSQISNGSRMTSTGRLHNRPTVDETGGGSPLQGGRLDGRRVDEERGWMKSGWRFRQFRLSHEHREARDFKRCGTSLQCAARLTRSLRQLPSIFSSSPLLPLSLSLSLALSPSPVPPLSHFCHTPTDIEATCVILCTHLVKVA